MFINTAVVLAAPRDWDEVLARTESVIPAGVPATLLSPYDTPDLTRSGWQLVGHPPLMARLPGAAAAPPVPAELRMHEVVDQPGLEVFERTLVDGFPLADLQPYQWGRFYDERILGGATRLWLGFVDGRPVATAAAHVAAGVNCVEMVATIERFRGHGYGAAVTWAATTADPTLPAILVASDPGRPVYERLGYTALTRWTMWLRP
jgi:GNAT superfamily N-acetyltransferase